MRILVAEDDPVHARLVQAALQPLSAQVLWVADGQAALDLARREPVDVVVTDWMMPRLDGIQLTAQLRQWVRPSPLVVMLTSLDHPDARVHALNSGADAFLAKPVGGMGLCSAIREILGRQKSGPVPRAVVPATPSAIVPAARFCRPVEPFIGVGLVGSTGGPAALTRLLESHPLAPNAAYLVALHGPDWVQQTLVETLAKATALRVKLAAFGEPVRPGCVYVAPGGCHLTIREATAEVDLRPRRGDHDLCPSGNMLLGSLAKAFGTGAVGVVLTGLGNDGAEGAAAIAAAGGTVLAKEPSNCTAPGMPTATLLTVGAAGRAHPLEALGSVLGDHVLSARRRAA